MIVFSKRDCPLVWKLVEYTFNNWTYLCKDVLAKEANKVSMQVKIGIRFHRAEITYFEIKRLPICSRQADSASRLYAKVFTFDKSSSIKYIICQKLRNSNGNTFSFIPHIRYFSYHLSIAASKTRSLTTLFSTKMRREETLSQEHKHPCLSNL